MTTPSPRHSSRSSSAGAVLERDPLRREPQVALRRITRRPHQAISRINPTMLRSQASHVLPEPRRRTPPAHPPPATTPSDRTLRESLALACHPSRSSSRVGGHRFAPTTRPGRAPTPVDPGAGNEHSRALLMATSARFQWPSPRDFVSAHVQILMAADTSAQECRAAVRPPASAGGLTISDRVTQVQLPPYSHIGIPSSVAFGSASPCPARPAVACCE